MDKTVREVNYKFYKDSKMMGMILLIITVSVQIFVYMKVPGMSTINAYTIGMVFGACNPFFYAYVIYISLTMVFKDSIKLPSWVKISKRSYWFVAVAVMFMVSASDHYQAVTNTWTSVGLKPFDAMPKWFEEFTSSDSAWYPESVWGGVVGALLYSVFASMVSGVGALIAAVVLLILSISILVTGTSIGLYKGIAIKKHLDLSKKEINQEESNEIEDMTDTFSINKPEDVPFPFDDPFKE